MSTSTNPTTTPAPASDSRPTPSPSELDQIQRSDAEWTSYRAGTHPRFMNASQAEALRAKAQASPAPTDDGTWRPAPPAPGADTSAARLAYSVAANNLDALRQHVAENPGDAEATAEIAKQEKHVRELGITAGVIAPPKKFAPPSYKPAPRNGHFRPNFDDGEGDGQSLEKRHENWHRGKAITEERRRAFEELRKSPSHFGADPEAGMTRHLTEYAKTVKIPPYTKPTWLEAAPFGSVDPALITSADLATMSSGMKEAFRKAINRERAVNATGDDVTEYGPFRPASKASAPEPLPSRPAPQPMTVTVNGRTFARGDKS